MAQAIEMTQEGYDNLERELSELKDKMVGEIAEKIRVARGYGDLSENAEYDAAKNEQAIVGARIATIEAQLANVKIVDYTASSGDVVSLGMTVKIYDMEMEEEAEYKIISPVETPNGTDCITSASPMGEALMNHKVGEEVEVMAPAGMYKVKILGIRK